MSDDWLRLIPEDPEFVPDLDAARRARERLAEMAPAAHAVDMSITGEPRFVDAGVNLEHAACPRCGAEIELDWVMEAIAEAHETSRLRDLGVRTPCCGAATSLNDLRYVWPAGFARFVLEARNPNVRDLRPDQLAELADVLGTPLRRIWQHL